MIQCGASLGLVTVIARDAVLSGDMMYPDPPLNIF